MRTIVLAILLAGCTVTQESVKQDGKRFDHRSSNQPYRAASCIARNLEEHASGLTASVRESQTPGVQEVSMRTTNGIMAYATVSPDGSGARISLWVSPYLIGAESMGRNALKGC